MGKTTGQQVTNAVDMAWAEGETVASIKKAARARGPYSHNVMGLTLKAHLNKWGADSADRVWAKCRAEFKRYGFPDTKPSQR